MGRDDWYRRATWSAADREAFLARLKRTRSTGNRAQYLLIQAKCLRKTKDEQLVRAALELVELMLRDYPEKIFLARAQYERAECLLTLGNVGDALESYRQALAVEREFPNVRTGAALRFGWTVVERRLETLYEEALTALEHYGTSLALANERYVFNAIVALINAAWGHTEQAKRNAQAALRAALETHSGLQYHPEVGLVTDTGGPVYDRLRELADS